MGKHSSSSGPQTGQSLRGSPFTDEIDISNPTIGSFKMLSHDWIRSSSSLGWNIVFGVLTIDVVLTSSPRSKVSKCFVLLIIWLHVSCTHMHFMRHNTISWLWWKLLILQWVSWCMILAISKVWVILWIWNKIRILKY
jgi:hypothetical protein